MSEEALLVTGVAAPAPWEGVGCACLAGVRSTDGRLALGRLTCEGADTLVSPGGPSIFYFLRTGKLTVGLFPRGTREGACKKKLSLCSKRN